MIATETSSTARSCPVRAVAVVLDLGVRVQLGVDEVGVFAVGDAAERVEEIFAADRPPAERRYQRRLGFVSITWTRHVYRQAAEEQTEYVVSSSAP